jgi:phosphoglycerate dehydrogenase-like enzyme
VPAHVETLTFIGDAAEVIERTRDADALIVSASPITRRVMEALEGLKVVVRGGVGYDVIDVPAATELGVVVVNIPDLWIREVANHALALLLAWNRKIVTLDREIRAGVWNSRVPGGVTGALHGETVGVVGLGNIGRPSRHGSSPAIPTWTTRASPPSASSASASRSWHRERTTSPSTPC